MMDAAYISAIAALAGSIVGGLTSLMASWLSQSVQARTQQLVEGKTQRQELYRSFIEEASKLYGDALVSDNADVANFIGLYALVSRMRVVSAQPVVEAADQVLVKIFDTYFSPNKRLQDLRGTMTNENMDVLRAFSEACREDLRRSRLD